MSRFTRFTLTLASASSARARWHRVQRCHRGRRRRRMADDDRWQPSYAWWPVRVGPLTWRWLMWVEKRITREAPSVTTVEYRLKAGPSYGPVRRVASVGTHTPDQAGLVTSGPPGNTRLAPALTLLNGAISQGPRAVATTDHGEVPERSIGLALQSVGGASQEASEGSNPFPLRQHQPEAHDAFRDPR